MAQDILQIKQRVSGMHVEFDEQDESTQKTYQDMQELKAKTDLILEALYGLQNSLQGKTSLVNSPGTLAKMEKQIVRFTKSSSQRRDKHRCLQLKISCQSQEKLRRIKSASALAAKKIVFIQAQYDALQAQIKIYMVSKDQEGTSGVTHDNPHSSEKSAGGKLFQTTWEK